MGGFHSSLPKVVERLDTLNAPESLPQASARRFFGHYIRITHARCHRLQDCRGAQPTRKFEPHRDWIKIARQDEAKGGISAAITYPYGTWARGDDHVDPGSQRLI